MTDAPPPKKNKKASIRFSSDITVDDGTGASLPKTTNDVTWEGKGKVPYSNPTYPSSYDRRNALRRKLQPKATGRFVGLVNQGATCYMNSLLQTLFMMHEFTYHLLNFSFPPEQQTAGNMLFQLQVLFSFLLGASASSIDTKGLTQAFGWKEQDSAVQQDVQELNRVLFDAIQKYLDRASDGPRHQFLKNLFEGEVVDFSTCMECHSTRCRVERFQDASLAIRGCRTLRECFDKYVVVEIMDGDNKVTCDKCGGPRDTKKGLMFKTFPEIFMIQLRRIDYNLHTMRREKLEDMIEISTEVDFSQWQLPEERSGAPLWYDLASVIVHRGTAYHGHYFAYIRVENAWYKFDDETVTVCVEEEIRVVLDPQVERPESQGEKDLAPLTTAKDPCNEGEGEDPTHTTATPPINIFEDLFKESEGAIKNGKSRRVVPAQSYYTVYRRRRRSTEENEGNSIPVVPAYIRSILELANDEHAKLSAEYDHLNALCEVGVYHGGCKTWVVPKYTSTISELTDLVGISLRLQTPRELFRVREYNVMLGVAGRSFGPDATLEELNFKPVQQTVCVDTRTDASVPWRVHHGDDMRLFVHRYDSVTRNFEDQVRLAVPGDATLRDLSSTLEATFGILAPSQIVVWKNKDTPIVILDGIEGAGWNPSQELRRDLTIDHGDLIYVESRDFPAVPADEEETTIHAINHIHGLHKCMVLYSLEDDTQHSLRFDMRHTFQDLKAKLSVHLCISDADLVLRWQGGREIRDLSVRLAPYVSGDCITLVLTRGRPMAADEHRIHFVRRGTNRPFLTKEYRGSTKTELLHQDVADSLGLPSKGYVRVRLSSQVKGSGCGDVLQVFPTVNDFMKGPVFSGMVTLCSEAVLVVIPTTVHEALTKDTLLLTLQPARLLQESHGDPMLTFSPSVETAIDKNTTWKQFFELLHRTYTWPVERIVVGKIKAMDVSDPKRWPTVLKSCTQLVSSFESKKLMHFPFYFQNDDLVLLFDGGCMTFTTPEPKTGGLRNRKPSPGSKRGTMKTVIAPERGVVIRTEYDPMPPTQQEPDLEDNKAENDIATDPPVDEDASAEPLHDDAGGKDGVLSNVPLVHYTAELHSTLDSARECAICRCDFTEGEDCLLLPCYHIFHKDCVDGWLEKHAKCPICQQCVL